MVTDVALLLFWGLGAIAVIGLAVVVGSAFVFLPGPASRVIGSSIAAALYIFGIYFWMTAGERERERERQSFREEFRPHAEYFERVCRSAGIKVFDTANGVSSVLLQAPRKETTDIDLADMWFTGDVYGGLDLSPEFSERRAVETFLTRRSWDAYPNPEGPSSREYLRYPTLEIKAEQGGQNGYFRYVDTSSHTQRTYSRTFVLMPRSRYEVRWLDISTPEDRDHWVAGSRWTIVDTASDKVMAERVGYVMDVLQGKQIAGAARPWQRAGNDQHKHRAKENSCPPRTAGHNLDFVRRVLTPLPQEIELVKR